MNRKFHIVTTGCQMNVLDSELAAALLISRGYTKAESQKEAEVILFNTCSVREHAEEKIYSALGRLKHWKSYHPDGVIGVFGCMAQKDRWVIFRRAPHVDVVVGPGQLDAAYALGYTNRKAFYRVILPQAVKNILPTLGNEFITLIKETSIVSFVGATDLYKAFNVMGTNTYEFMVPYLSMALIYIVMVLIISLLIKLMERRLRKSDKSL